MITLFSLLIVAAYVVISVAVIVVVGKKKSAKAAGIVAGALFLLGTWDVILGRAALWYSCEYKRVSKMPLEKVQLSQKYFNRNGHVNWSLLEKEKKYSATYVTTKNIGWLGLEEFRVSVLDATSGSNVATYTDFHVSAGWLERFVSPRMDGCISDGTSLDSIFSSSNDVRDEGSGK